MEQTKKIVNFQTELNQFNDFIKFFDLKIEHNEGVYLVPNNSANKIILKIKYKKWRSAVAKYYNLNIKAYNYYFNSSAHTRRLKFVFEDIYNNFYIDLIRGFNSEVKYKIAFKLFLKGKYTSMDLNFDEFIKIYDLAIDLYHLILFPRYPYSEEEDNKYRTLKIDLKSFEKYAVHYFKIDKKRCLKIYIEYPNNEDCILKIDKLFEIKPTIRQMYEIVYNLYGDGKYFKKQHN